MALRGTLKDFAFPEILQLIGHQQKTGVLTLQEGAAEVRVLFSEGKVVGAVHSQGLWGKSLGSFCLKAGIITDAELAAARDVQRETLKSLESILLNSQSVDPDALRTVSRMVMLEIIYDLFQWKRGTYNFEQKPVGYDERMVQPVAAESLMMEGYRIVDELPTVVRLVPDMNRLYQALPQTADRYESMTEDERRLFTALRQEMSPVDLMFTLRVGRFDTVKGIAGLLQKGLIQAVEDENTLLLTETAETGSRSRLVRYAAIVAVAACLVLFGRAVWVTGSYFVVGAADSDSPALTAAVAAVQRDRIAAALEAYRLLEGRYPASLDALVQKKLLESGDLFYPHDLPYRYLPQAEGVGYTLENP